MTKKRQILYKVWWGLGLALVLALLAWFALSGDNAELLKSLFTDELSNDEWSRRLQSFGPRGYITVTVLAALQIVCTVFPAAPLQVLAGFAFGFFKGLLCCVVGVLIGNSLIFWLQKMFGDRLRGFFVKKLNVDLEKTAASSKGVLLVFLLFLVPIVPYGMICFLAAGMGMSYRRYMTVTTLGTLPAMVFSLGLGRMLLTLHWTAMAVILAVLIVLVVLLFAQLPLTVSAATVSGGTCGANLTWTLDDQGTLTISGTGAMSNWDDMDQNLIVPWNSYKNSVKSVVIVTDLLSSGTSFLHSLINRQTEHIFRLITQISIPVWVLRELPALCRV